MPGPLSPVTISLLEKVATDNGFDRELVREGDWLVFASTQCPLHVWLGAGADTTFLAALSQRNVARELRQHGAATTVPLPAEALEALEIAGIPDLHRFLRRAFQLSKTLPHELLHEFERKAAALPNTTEAERLVVQRVGQDVFRQGLLEFWDERCAVTGLAVAEILRASHIKPWAHCVSDAERLDVYNGLLLAPNLDAVFDGGLITVLDDGPVVMSDRLNDQARRLLGLDDSLRVRSLADGHRAYLGWHRAHVFHAK